jgi:glutathione S-transferase
MLTLFHAPQSRASAIRVLIDEMGIADRLSLRTVTIRRRDGSGGRDPANPHPEGKVPALVHDGAVITERAAIILHLCTLFPDTGLSPRPGTPDWGRFVTWLVWYQGVVEPVVICAMLGVDHPGLAANWAGLSAVTARLRQALDRGPWLMGPQYTAADLLLHSPFVWAPQTAPDDPVIADWIARVRDRPALAAVRAAEAAV